MGCISVWGQRREIGGVAQGPGFDYDGVEKSSEEGLVGGARLFTAEVSPINATLPITYIWQASNHPPATHSGGITDTIILTWPITGTQVVTVTASNPFGSVSRAITLTINLPSSFMYLPTSFHQPDVPGNLRQEP